MRPLIGITSHMELDQENNIIGKEDVEAITRAGGIPVVLPNISDEDKIQELAERIDGLYVSGGADVDPLLYGEEPHKDLGGITPNRDFFEITISKKVLEMGKPFIGVCRGAQVLNVALGGTLYQDIHAQTENELIKHLQKAPNSYETHFAKVEAGSLLNRIAGKDKLKVNSYHHQACKDTGKGLKVSATASDGIIEAIEGTGENFVLGIQWHPEHLLDTNEESLAFFKAFVEACKEN
ncbi:gamma-glutamyl-gamma-aminobutyrate hydrolase family protein [Ornithinibacillus sp. 4-3]|uniref:Gamma-glutamyl-gamma-aminobutyrate hydrolase family protein n=1 Tax=Ornithinibacillus sp. 4-3 TaxID=3231488 RepID=A0AB39HUK9_9BACI